MIRTDNSFHIGLETLALAEFGVLMDKIGKYKRYSAKVNAYGARVRAALASSREDQFPLLRAWLLETDGALTPYEQNMRLYDDAVTQLDRERLAAEERSR